MRLRKGDQDPGVLRRGWYECATGCRRLGMCGRSCAGDASGVPEKGGAVVTMWLALTMWKDGAIGGSRVQCQVPRDTAVGSAATCPGSTSLKGHAQDLSLRIKRCPRLKPMSISLVRQGRCFVCWYSRLAVSPVRGRVVWPYPNLAASPVRPHCRGDRKYCKVQKWGRREHHSAAWSVRPWGQSCFARPGHKLRRGR